VFTAVQRELGLPPGDLTEEMIDAAVQAQVAETDDLDFKSKLPPTSNLNTDDFPKDIAAMANSGGGTILYGFTEDQKKVTGRKDVGELTENHERTLRSAAVTAISPPVFGLEIVRIGDEGSRCVAVIVPASVDGPHLIYRNDFFGAPIRNDADTVWMKEREVAVQYRARFDAARHVNEVLDKLYTNAVEGCDIAQRAWLIAAAHPRTTTSPLTRGDRESARQLYFAAMDYSLNFALNQSTIRPIASGDYQNPRPGLRRWVAPNKMTSDASNWQSATSSIHHDGSITMAVAVGAHKRRDGYYEGWRISSGVVEAATADVMGMIRAVGQAVGAVDYEVRVGIEWTGEEPLKFYYKEHHIDFDTEAGVVPIHRFVPVEATVEVRDLDDESYLQQVRLLAEDAVNQGGVTDLQLIKTKLDPQR
jgi:hypothetical protein